MKTLVVSALALGAMTSVALAGEPAKPTPAKAATVVLTEAQMDRVAAGQLGISLVSLNLALPIALNVLTADSIADAATGDQAIDVGTGG